MGIVTTIGQVAGQGLALVAPAALRNRLEQPRYEILLMDKPVELRRYDAQLVAEVSGHGDREATVRKLYPILQDYIAAAHRPGPEIEPTTPMEHVPLTLSRAGDATTGVTHRLRFVMPRDWTMETLPRPKDDRIRIRTLPERMVAALTFEGAPDDEAIQRHEPALRDWLAAQGMAAEGACEFAYYDPPVTPDALRLNEVRLEVG